MFVNRTKTLCMMVSGPLVSYFHKQTEKALIRQLLQELPDQGLLSLQKR